jgi:uncharacterized protein YndB with AHSA1/START domain
MIIHKTITVARPPDVAFKIFVEEIGQWWPNEKYMFLGAESKATIETRVGGRVYNRHPDGREYVIGQVVRYEPGARLTFTWNHGDGLGITEIDVRFTVVGAGTRVDLAHSGWERLVDAEQKSAGFNAGWDEILDLFVGYADTKTAADG